MKTKIWHAPCSKYHARGECPLDPPPVEENRMPQSDSLTLIQESIRLGEKRLSLGRHHEDDLSIIKQLTGTLKTAEKAIQQYRGAIWALMEDVSVFRYQDAKNKATNVLSL